MLSVRCELVAQDRQTLRPEEAVLAAAERGALRLTRTTVVVNGPGVVEAGGRALPGASAR